MKQESRSLLIDIINTELEVDIRHKSRAKKVVLGRYIFSQIARDAGMRLQDIGKALNVHHATVLHYLRNFDGYMHTDKNARDLYESIYDGAPDECNKVYTMTVSELRSEVRKLSEQNKNLSLVIVNLNGEIKRLKSEDDRLNPIISLVKQGVPRGKEEDARIKFNHIINGLR